MQLNKNNMSIDEQKNKIIELIKKNKGLQKSIELDIHNLHDSVINYVREDEVCPYASFLLVSKNAWYSFDRNKDLAKNAKIKIRKGNRKILIKIKFFYCFLS